MDPIDTAPMQQSINEKLKQWKSVNTNQAKPPIAAARNFRSQTASSTLPISQSGKESGRDVWKPTAETTRIATARLSTQGSSQILKPASRSSSAFYIPSSDSNATSDLISPRSGKVATQSKSKLIAPVQTRRISRDSSHPVIVNRTDNSFRSDIRIECNSYATCDRSESDRSGFVNADRVPLKTSDGRNIPNVNTKKSRDISPKNPSRTSTKNPTTSSSPKRLRNEAPADQKLSPNKIKISNSSAKSPESRIRNPRPGPSPDSDPAIRISINSEVNLSTDGES